MTVAETDTGSRAGFHPRHRPRRSRIRPAQDRGHPLPAGAERLSAYRPRQVDLPQFRHRRGIWRPLQSALRRHQPDQGRAGIYRRHRARRALARLRLGRASLSRVGLFRAALRVGGTSDPRRQGLCRRPDAGGDAAHARHPDRGRDREPISRPQRRGKSRPVPPHARRRISQRRARAARQDRHGVGQHQSARSGALPHPARRASAHRQPSGASIRATISPTASRTPSRASPTRSARSNSRITGRSTTGSSTICRCRRVRINTSSRGSISPTRCCRSACSPNWCAAAMSTAGTIRACRRWRACAGAACRRRRSAISSSASASPRPTASSTSAMLEFSIREHLNRTAQRRMAVLRPLKIVIENYPEGQSEEIEAVNHPEDRQRRHAAHPLRPRAFHRARRFHGKSAEEILSPGAGPRGAAALRLFHHLPRGGEGCGRRGDRAALHLRSGDPRRQRARTAARSRRRCTGSSAADAVPAEVRLYNPLFTRPDPDAGELCRRPQSAVARSDCRCARRAGAWRSKIRPMPCSSSGRAISAATWIRRPERLVFNRTVGLRDSWAKVAGGS